MIANGPILGKDGHDRVVAELQRRSMLPLVVVVVVVGDGTSVLGDFITVEKVVLKQVANDGGVTASGFFIDPSNPKQGNNVSVAAS